MLAWLRRTLPIAPCVLLAACGGEKTGETAPPSREFGGGPNLRPDAALSDGATLEAGTIHVGPIPDAAPPICGVDAGRKPVTKVDLLFMIDNSASMADKQEVLARTVPDLVNRLVNPVCVDPVTFAQVGMRDANGNCAAGQVDFPPVNDIHIGIISSSLGGHGADVIGSSKVCDDVTDLQRGRTDPHNNDAGHLLSRGEGVTTFQGKGFLNWNPSGGGANTPSGINTSFASMVKGIGQHGCGYEASLEAIYRFLIDPNPHESIAVTPDLNSVGLAMRVGTDKALLQQRADFLRPDSLVAVIALTDENDCSIMDGGQNFYPLLPSVGAQSILQHGTSACRTNPNDPCCYNCGQVTPAGCPDKASDPECQAGRLSRAEDPENLRCFHQKERYGIDFLYPVKRYTDGFTQSTIDDGTGKQTPNPLFSDLVCGGRNCAPPRDKSLVFLAGIIGVPWQDIANDANDLTRGYKTARQLADDNVWPVILGQPAGSSGARPVPPKDLHMVESVAPRPGLPGPASAATADKIHGHEWDTTKTAVTAGSDLQYACIFPLAVPKDCAVQTDCECADSAAGDSKNPLCQDLATGAYSSVQARAKAYPGVRELQVLQGVGEQGIVASICPANMLDANRADFGYRPAIAAIVDRLRTPLRGCDFVR